MRYTLALVIALLPLTAVAGEDMARCIVATATVQSAGFTNRCQGDVVITYEILGSCTRRAEQITLQPEEQRLPIPAGCPYQFSACAGNACTSGRN